MKGSTRWALVTFALGISSGIIGRYIPDTAIAAIIVISLSVLFALFGSASVEDND